MQEILRAPRIAVLSPELSNQIAAGEVVERPASVVKELCENALDAGARRIEVEIERGGLGLIRVTDDGSGMTAEEAELCLVRHATSKIKCIEDLFALSSMGFRGEALPSVAAVSRFQLTTRTPEAEAAVRLTIDGGQKIGPRPASAQVGTQIEVRELLYNVPARLKFMKGEATEAGHISEAVLRLSLSFPKVHFRLRAGARVVLDLPPHAGRLERAQAALSSRLRGAGAGLHTARGEEAAVRVEAQLGPPSEATTTPRNVYLLVNGRFVRDRSLLHAVGMGYGEQLGPGRYPLCVLHVDLPPDAVDVNVHPQKMEVRFERPQEVYAAVRHTLSRLTLQAPWLVGDERPRQYSMGGDAGGADENGADPLSSADDHELREERPRYGAFPPSDVLRPPPLSLSPTYERNIAQNGGGLDEHRARLQQALRFQAPPSVLEGDGPAAPPRRRFFSAMSYLGQYGRTYLLCEHERELLLIDQHAAHESLCYARLRAARQAQAGAALRSQRLLLPLQLELDPQRAALALEEGEALGALGFEVRPFGGRSFALQAVPDVALFGRGARIYQDPERLLGKVLDDFLEHGRSEAIEGRMDRVLATLACHSVVRAGDVLDETRAQALLEAMDEVDFVPSCPHGRPVLVRMALTEIERRFGR